MYNVFKDPEFTPYSPKYLDIDDLVIVFYDGKKWKIIPLEDMYQYPVIYDKYLEDEISVTLCPFSHSAVIYFDKWKPLKEIVNNNIVLQHKKNKNIKMNQLSGKIINYKDADEIIVIRKNEVVIMKVKTVLKNYPDCLYFNNTKKVKSIIPNNYLSTNNIIHPMSQELDKLYHPKKLVYGVMYSINDMTLVIVSKGDEMDFDESGYQEYFDGEIKDIKNNGGFIIPCLWFSWMDNYPKSTVIKI